jgi:soluble lytic murein transglycosylase-like protein
MMRAAVVALARCTGWTGFAVLAASLLVSVPHAAAADGDAPPALAVAAASRAPTSAAADVSHRGLVKQEALRAGLPPEVADAVTEVESSYRPDTIGADGEIGLMQVMPATARMLGFGGSTTELADPATNIHYGVTYLAKAWRLAGGDICTATMKYRAGHGETRFSQRSVEYCLRVRAKLAARGFPVTGTVPVATFGTASWPTGASGGRARSFARRLGGPRGPDLASLNSQLRAVTEVAAASARTITLR